MAIPKIEKHHIVEAIKYIDENGVPEKNQSNVYNLVTEDGKKYPPKYVIAVADHLANGGEIKTTGYNAVEAVRYFLNEGYNVEDQNIEYELTITADSVTSTDPEFTMDDLESGNGYRVVNTYFERADGTRIARKYNSGEVRNSNQTMPRLAFQVFEGNLSALSKQEKENFPVCKYTTDGELISGIYSNPEELQKARKNKSIEYLNYESQSNKFTIYSWNTFSTIYFVKECLIRFGESGDRFVLKYRPKTKKEWGISESGKSNNKGWIPKLEEYTPGISKEDWLNLLNDSTVFTANSLLVVYRMLDYGGAATCKQLANKYGGKFGFYSIISSTLAKKVHEVTNCPLSNHKDGSIAWWAVLYIGKTPDNKSDGVWVWKLRDELKEALEEAKIPVDIYANGEGVFEYINKYSETLVNSKNIILRGAPGTGKTYLAKQIAADIVSGGITDDYSSLTLEQQRQIGFVQFHPSYDYSDFVEGLRPKKTDDENVGFELKDGIFKEFVGVARENYENAQKTKEEAENVTSAQEAMADFFDNVEFDEYRFKTITGIKFCITNVTDKHIYITKEGNDLTKHLTLSMSEIRKMVESEQTFDKVSDITKFFGKRFATQGYSYEFILYQEIIKLKSQKKDPNFTKEEKKDFVFIIDEINRGEISKILGELFFSIDPGYRGKNGSVSTQYSNLHDDPDEKFYIPENVYIIGTMNDIDRSVDSFDFAMRRRFRFIEIKADENIDMLDCLGAQKDEAVKRMQSLNAAIVNVPDLNANYQIGAAYFKKLEEMSYEDLWNDSLQPLLQDYVRGMYDEEKLMKKFEDAYNLNDKSAVEDASDEGTQD